MQRHVESIDLSIRKMLAKQKDAVIGNLRKLVENNLDFRKNTVRNTDQDLVLTAFLQRQPGLQNIRQMFGALIANPADADPHNTFPSAEVCTNICGPAAVPGAMVCSSESIRANKISSTEAVENVLMSSLARSDFLAASSRRLPS